MVTTYFKWAEFRSTKADIKLHTKFDLGKGVSEQKPYIYLIKLMIEMSKINCGRI